MRAFLLFCLSVLLSGGLFAEAGVVRHAVIVGVNDGGPERQQLKYATVDAQSIYGVFTSLGGLSAERTQLMLEPSANDLIAALAKVEGDIATAKLSSVSPAPRVEFLFYYSGHSDEKALLIGQEAVSYEQLKVAIDKIDADVTVAMLDSCASGAFTRLKGGTHVKPFLANSATSVNGYAYLASSSADEAAQESDAIGGAYFTHYMVSALRGAGDLSADNKVTLNEAYHFAFNETLARTEGSQYGAQHAAYNIQLSGEGDLVLTDLNQTSGELILGKDITGRLYIRDARGNLMVELSKNELKPLKIGLEPGAYKITLEREGEIFRSESFAVSKGISTLSMDDLSLAQTELASARGGSLESLPALDVVDVDVKLSFTESKSSPATLPGERQRVKWDFNLFGNKTYTIDGLSAGALLTHTEQNTRGVQLAGFYNRIGGDLNGVAISGLMNDVGGDVERSFMLTGGLNLIGGTLEQAFTMGAVNLAMVSADQSFMAAGLLNYTPEFSQGGQLTGAINYAEFFNQGVQGAGALNYADHFAEGVQISGGVNFAKTFEQGLQLTGGVNTALTVDHGVQIGTVNIANTIRGSQIGVVNVARELDGEAIGLLNFIGNGRHGVSLRYNERQMPTLELKTGGRSTYTELAVGKRMDDDLTSVSVAFGVRMLDLRSHFLEADFGQVQYLKPEGCVICSNPTITDKSITRLRFNLGQKVTRHINLVAGISLNGTLDGWNTDYWSNEPIANFAQNYLTDALWQEGNGRRWVGYSFGLEIL